MKLKANRVIGGLGEGVAYLIFECNQAIQSSGEFPSRAGAAQTTVRCDSGIAAIARGWGRTKTRERTRTRKRKRKREEEEQRKSQRYGGGGCARLFLTLGHVA